MIEEFLLVFAFSLTMVMIYRQGIKDGKKVSNGENITLFEFDEEAPELSREEKIRNNIENYNGGDEGQVDIDE